MQAQDVMTTKVVTVAPDTPVTEIAKLLYERQISAVPVLSEDGQLLGMVSEGDLTHGLAQEGVKRSWWLDLLASPQTRAEAYLKGHGRLAWDVMSRSVISVTPDTPLPEIARLLETHRIKRVPVLQNGKLVGIVSRADLLRGFALQPSPDASAEDRAVRERITAEFERLGLASHPYVNIVVRDGVVHLWGVVAVREEGEALRRAAERVPGVASVDSHLMVNPRVAAWR
ncbi:MAG TPA: CBS domain-containing protein [Geminicoccaceae bacterium]|nr:CBS domain-containing protein [Geminicoccaceae bacterium]